MRRRIYNSGEKACVLSLLFSALPVPSLAVVRSYLGASRVVRIAPRGSKRYQAICTMRVCSKSVLLDQDANYATSCGRTIMCVHMLRTTPEFLLNQ